MTSTSAAVPQKNVLILYATMTGNTRDAVEAFCAALRERGIGFRIAEMGNFDPRALAAEHHAVLMTSTFGNGDPPDSAFFFWDVLRRADGLNLSALNFSVLALGDSAYPRFCQFGRDLDERLGALGAKRLAPVQLCDVDWEEPMMEWCSAVVGELAR